MKAKATLYYFTSHTAVERLPESAAAPVTEVTRPAQVYDHKLAVQNLEPVTF